MVTSKDEMTRDEMSDLLWEALLLLGETVQDIRRMGDAVDRGVSSRASCRAFADRVSAARADIGRRAALRAPAVPPADLVVLVREVQHEHELMAGGPVSARMLALWDKLLAYPLPAAPRVPDTRCAALADENAKLREALSQMVKQKHEPSEYYGTQDDLRCAFCGEDYTGHDRDSDERHRDGCAWVAARALLEGRHGDQ